MKLKIVSKGLDTKVVNAETDEVLGFVKKIVWEADADKLVPVCTVTLLNVEVDLEVDAKVTK